jgi:DNA polymerase III delta prime subunit
MAVITVNSKDNIFENQAPAPLSKFNRSVIDEDNDLILRENEDARLLPRALVRKYEKRLKQLNRQVEQSGYYSLREKLEALKQDWSAIQLELYPIRIEYQQLKGQPDSDALRDCINRGRSLIQQQKQIEKQINEVKEQIKPLLPVVRKRNTCEARLKEHHAAVIFQKQEEEERKRLHKEASWWGNLIIERLTQMNYCHRWTTSKGGKTKTHVDKVRFQRIIVTPDSIQYKFHVSTVGVFGNTRVHLPLGVSVQDLIKPETLNELTMACERSVTSPHVNGTNFVNGVWIEVTRNDFVDGLPKLVNYKQVMARYPNEIREKYPLPLGVMSGKKVNVVKLTEHPHLLISGQSGAGKSNTLHVILTTLIQKHSPDELRLCLIDLKAGVEFVSYDNIPHLVTEKPIATVQEAAKVLWQLQTLINIRLEEIKKLGVMARDIDAFNRYAPAERKMPRIVVVIEEIQLIDNDKELAKQIRRACDVIASTGRAAGIQLIICTQAPFSDVIPKITQAQVSLKIAGSQESLGSALAATGNAMTKHLKQHPGRMFVKKGPEFIEVQMPLVVYDDIQTALNTAAEFDAPRPLELPALPDQNEDESGEGIQLTPLAISSEIIVEFALKVLGGELNASKMIEAGLNTKYNIGKKKLRDMVGEIRSQETVKHDGEEYEIVIEKGNIARLVGLSGLASVS